MKTIDYGNFEIAYREVGGIEPWEAYLIWWLRRRLRRIRGGIGSVRLAVVAEMFRFFCFGDFDMHISGDILVVETRDGNTVCSIRESVPGQVDS